MTEKQKDDIYYVCSLIEFIARKTKNHRQDVIRYFSKKDIQRQLRLAEVNHCLSFEQVADELIEDYGIKNGDFDTVKEYPNMKFHLLHLLGCSIRTGFIYNEGGRCQSRNHRRFFIVHHR